MIFTPAFLLLIVIFFIFLVIIFFMILAWFSFAPWVPTRNRDFERIFKLAKLKPGETFYDLGCGDGKLVCYAAKHYQAKAYGAELALPLFLLCLIKKIFSGSKNLCFEFKNLFKVDLQNANVIYFFGLPETINNKLKEKLEREARPGTRIISYAFKINDWLPQLVDQPTENDIPIYLYIKA